MTPEFPKRYLANHESYDQTAFAWRSVCTGVFSDLDPEGRWRPWFPTAECFDRTILEGAAICSFVNSDACLGFLLYPLDDDETLSFSAYLDKWGGDDTATTQIQTLVLHSAPKCRGRVGELLRDWISGRFSITEMSERLRRAEAAGEQG